MEMHAHKEMCNSISKHANNVKCICLDKKKKTLKMCP